MPNQVCNAELHLDLTEYESPAAKDRAAAEARLSVIFAVISGGAWWHKLLHAASCDCQTNLEQAPLKYEYEQEGFGKKEQTAHPRCLHK